MAVFEGRESSSDIGINDTMRDNEVVASDVAPAELVIVCSHGFHLWLYAVIGSVVNICFFSFHSASSSSTSALPTTSTTTVFRPEEFSNPEFAQESLPLLFDIFRQSKNNENLVAKIAAIFKKCYGEEPIPEIPEGGYTPPAKIGRRT